MKALAGKRVVLVIENEAVPFDRRMWNIARALKEFGADVSVICPKFGKDAEKDVVLDGIAVHRYDNTFSDGSVLGYLREYSAALVKTVVLLHKLLLQHHCGIDVVHVANPPDVFWPLALYLRLFGVKFVFDEHDIAPKAYLSRFGKSRIGRDPLYWIQVWCQRLSYRFADAIISTNESYRECAVTADPRYAGKTFVVRNGPDTRHFRVQEADPSLKRGRSHLAAYIGVMAVQDGVEYIVRAVDELIHRRGYRDFVVYLIGSGDDWERIRQLVDDLGLADHIVLTGRIPDDEALAILSTADVFLSPDPKNPLNDVSTMTKVMEYMSLGGPIVSFDLKETRFSAGDSALYVRDNDAVAFADGMVALLADPARGRRMAELGVARVNDELSWQKQSLALLAAYEFVTDRQGARWRGCA